MTERLSVVPFLISVSKFSYHDATPAPSYSKIIPSMGYLFRQARIPFLPCISNSWFFLRVSIGFLANICFFFQNVIRWTTPLQRGYFNVIVHYFQPNHPSTVVKIIINTQFSSIAGNIHLSYCPHIDGCRALVLSEDSSFHRVEGIYVTGDQIQATFVTLPDGFQAWIVSIYMYR